MHEEVFKRHSSVLLPPFGRTGKAVRDATGMRRGPSARRLLLSAGWVGPWILQVSCPEREGGRRETQLFLQLSGREESRGQGDLRTGSLRARTRPPRTLQRGRPVRGRAPPEGALDLRVRGAAGAGGAAAGGLVRAVRAWLAWRGAGDQKESLRPRSQPGNSRARFSRDLVRSNQGRGLTKVILIILNVHIAHYVPHTAVNLH